MKWFEHPRRHVATEAENLSYSPSSGPVQMVLLGVILPLVLLSLGIQAWVTEEAVWFGRRNTDLEFSGRSAKSLGVVYGSGALFCHFRWFWGLIPVYRMFEIGTILSLLGIVGGLGFGVYYLLG